MPPKQTMDGFFAGDLDNGKNAPVNAPVDVPVKEGTTWTVEDKILLFCATPKSILEIAGYLVPAFTMNCEVLNEPKSFFSFLQ